MPRIRWGVVNGGTHFQSHIRFSNYIYIVSQKPFLENIRGGELKPFISNGSLKDGILYINN